MQYLLLAAMCKIVTMLSSKNSAGCLSADLTEQKQQCCFVSAAIAFCKFQQLDPTVPIKTQVSKLSPFLSCGKFEVWSVLRFPYFFLM